MAWNVVGNIKGPKGDKGDTGATGQTGPAGPAGPSGASGLNWRGTYDNATAYAANDAVSYGGSSWFTTAAVTGTVPTSDPTDSPPVANSPWQPLSLHGATGPQGPAGAAGAAATVAVGTVSTGVPGSQAAVTNGGSSSAAVLNFTIPQGATGATGPAGPTGPAGVQGPTGPAGPTGQRGSLWYTGSGAPGTISGSLPGDQYLDTATGDVYTLS